jgi:hypothetical protein
VRLGGHVVWLWFQSECVRELQTAMCSRARNCTTRLRWSRPVKYGPLPERELETNALPAAVVGGWPVCPSAVDPYPGYDGFWPPSRVEHPTR